MESDKDSINTKGIWTLSRLEVFRRTSNLDEQNEVMLRAGVEPARAFGQRIFKSVISENAALRSAVKSFHRLAEQHHVLLEFIKPGRPMQNGLIERSNRRHLEAVLDMFVF